MLRPGDGLEHRREDLVAVPEHLDEVPLRRGHADDAFELPADLGDAIRSAQIGPVHVEGRAHDAALTAAGLERASELETSDTGASDSVGRRGAGTPARTASSCAAIATP